MKAKGLRQQMNLNARDLPLLIIFFAAFFAGLNKLKYGFSFIDEGMYLTDAWRLSAGDTFFPDSSRFSASLYNIFSSIFFMINPELSVLDVRKIQFALSTIALASVLGSIARYIPGSFKQTVTLSIPFVFLGLDPLGHTNSLSYTTIPNFFFIVLFALYINYHFSESTKASFFAALGISIVNAFLTFSYLPLGLTYISTLLLFRISKPQLWAYHTALLSIGLLVFLGCLQPDFIEWFNAVSDQLYVSRRTSQGITPWAVQICIVSGIISCLLIWSINRAQTRVLEASTVLSWSAPAIGLTFFAWGYGTSFSGLLTPVYNGWFDTTGILIIANLVTAAIGIHAFANRHGVLLTKAHRIEVLGFIGLIYFILFSFAYVVTSSMGILEVAIGTFVLWVSFALIIVNDPKPHAIRKNLFFVAIFLPSAAALPIFDWSFTHFDDVPSRLNVKIESGPARGLVTSQLNHDVEKAIRETIAEHTNEDDFLLSWEQTPMPYFLGRRRPAIDHSWVGITKGDPQIDAKVIEKMISHQREPKMAIFWSNKLLVFPEARGGQTWRSGSSPAPNTLITEYVRENMQGIKIIQVNGENAVEFYLRKQNE